MCSLRLRGKCCTPSIYVKGVWCLDTTYRTQIVDLNFFMYYFVSGIISLSVIGELLKYERKGKILMNMITVNSSDISAIGYENSVLYVRFHKGGTYSYRNVPQTLYNQLMSASSHGSFFAHNIKNNSMYPCTKL